MRIIHIKAITYYKKGRLVRRPAFTKRITPKLVRAAQKNLARGRSKWAGMSQVQRLRRTERPHMFRVLTKQLNIKRIPKLEAK